MILIDGVGGRLRGSDNIEQATPIRRLEAGSKIGHRDATALSGGLGAIDAIGEDARQLIDLLLKFVDARGLSRAHPHLLHDNAFPLFVGAFSEHG